MANTTNLNLGKLGGSEKLKTYPTTQAENMDIIDSAFGEGFGVSGAHTVSSSFGAVQDGIAIVSNNNTHAAITSGQWVYVKNHGSLSEGLYRATTNIAANGTLSGSNLTADSNGGLNAVYSDLSGRISTLNSKFDPNSTDAIANCNTLLTTGRYKAINSTLNTPFAEHFIIDVIAYNSSEITQVARLTSSSRVFARGTNNGGSTWSSWEEFALNRKLSSASISIDTSNKTTFTFSDLHNLNNSSIFKHGLLVWGISSNSQSAGISFVFVDTNGNVTVINLTGNTDRTFTGSVSGTTLTITASQTMYGGLKLIWLT